jgi:1-hydroxycarotenoid 3,4-desaturase
MAETPHIVVVGAGVGGLVAALGLAVAGMAVTVLERAATPGGKLREVIAGGCPIDAGPTVFTMRFVFEEIFAAAGASLADHLTLQPAEILARHAWSATERLDLFADPARSEDAIGAFAGAAEARGFRDFCARAKGIWQTLEQPFIRAPRPTPISLVRGAGLRGLPDMWRISPFATLWGALGEHFADPRLRQMFGRYSTYAGSSPFLAPATLMLIAHVEQDGVWLVDGGMHRIAQALAGLLTARGGTLRTGAHVAAIETERGRASGVRLADGERIAADAVIFNGDSAALAAGLLGSQVRGASPAVAPADRSLSAVTWAMRATAGGFPLLRHSVFFSRDYPAEFADILGRHRLPGGPTVYICAQDRGAADAPPPAGPERLLCLVNAPPTGDTRAPSPQEIAACETATFRLLTDCGLTLDRTAEATVLTQPAQFAQLFPATGGSLYGQAVHGAMASFRRPGARSGIPGLYLAGGSTHPGAGVPMAALSGRLAAFSLIADLASTGSSRRAAMRGGIWTRSATTAPTA